MTIKYRPERSQAEKDQRRWEQAGRFAASDGSGPQARFQTFVVAERLLLRSAKPEDITTQDLRALYETLVIMAAEALRAHGPSARQFVALLGRARTAQTFLAYR